MRKYYKLLIIPCVLIIVSLYLIGIDTVNRTDRVDDPTQRAAEVAHYLYGTETENGNGNENGKDENQSQSQEKSDAESEHKADEQGAQGDEPSGSDSQTEGGADKNESAPPELVNNAGKININTATKEELMTLDGIGEKYAERIIELREKIGGFTSIDQITEVKGIGKKRLEKIRDDITV